MHSLQQKALLQCAAEKCRQAKLPLRYVFACFANAEVEPMVVKENY